MYISFPARATCFVDMDAQLAHFEASLGSESLGAGSAGRKWQHVSRTAKLGGRDPKFRLKGP